MRVTTGVCVLAAGLLFSAGAIAHADTEASGSSTSSGPSQGVDEASSATASTNTQAGSTAADDTDSDKAPTATVGRTGSLREDGDDASTLTDADDEQVNAQETTDAASDAESSGGGADATEAGASDTTGAAGATDATVATEAEPVAQTPAPVVPAETTAASSDSGTGGSQPTPAAPAPSAATPPANPVTSAVRTVTPANAFGPVTNALTVMATLVHSVPATLAALQTSPTPVTDALVSFQVLLTEVTNAVLPLAQVPGDLYTLLGIPPSTARPLIGVSGISHAGTITVAVDAPLLGPLAGSAPLPGSTDAAGAPLFGTMTPHAAPGTSATTAAPQSLTLSGTAPLSEAALVDTRSILEHVIEAVLVPASLTALAAVALPGVAGLLVVLAAGMRVGYRQAKAGLVVRASKIARFTEPAAGRSVSMVTLRQRARGPRTLRAVCPQAAQSARALEPVA